MDPNGPKVSMVSKDLVSAQALLTSLWMHVDGCSLTSRAAFRSFCARPGAVRTPHLAHRLKPQGVVLILFWPQSANENMEVLQLQAHALTDEYDCMYTYNRYYTCASCACVCVCRCYMVYNNNAFSNAFWTLEVQSACRLERYLCFFNSPHGLFPAMSYTWASL